jgi:hypothetical protein
MSTCAPCVPPSPQQALVRRQLQGTTARAAAAALAAAERERAAALAASIAKARAADSLQRRRDVDGRVLSIAMQQAGWVVDDKFNCNHVLSRATSAPSSCGALQSLSSGRQQVVACANSVATVDLGMVLCTPRGARRLNVWLPEATGVSGSVSADFGVGAWYH